ncbi:hypothetical protein AXG93_2834s1180 [Marchantia polymorpha subsp. ruderalis]|uniref:Uncharacterized protein n=1 Tax=Marchantia polymorpha subsp. ruderalis TaxID=1480154 RepID=A0A176WI90_MARPO|nr:hypothetical protein AXG93_2834s1180 [Marchantia polymorpha subsp. ruderalis]
MEGAGGSIVSDAAELTTRGMDSERMEGAGGSIVSDAAELTTRGMDSERMEGAGGSIVSDAAELTTRGMDSADEEQELPSAIQDLIRRLEGEGEPITALPDLSGPKFLEFFPKRESLSTITGWRSQVRLQVLEAIARCNTLKILSVYCICEGDISRLTDSEWKVVLKGFRYSTVLRTIEVRAVRRRDSEAEVESWYLELGKILSTSSVTELKLISCYLSARCILNLASGLQGNSNSKLQSLHLNCSWDDTNVVKHVADMINSAPLLETLELLSKWHQMEDETVGILSHALIKRSSLKELKLGCGWGGDLWRVMSPQEQALCGLSPQEPDLWGAALLLKALAGDDGNRSVERLRLTHWRGLGDCIGKLLTCNPSLKEMELNVLEMSPEEWHQLGEVIRDNAIATTILAKFNFCGGDQWKSIEALASSASSDVKDPIVELDLLLPSGNFDFYLMLSLALLELDEEAFRDLMAVLQVNLALQTIDVSRTSWAKDGKAAQIQDALKQNEKRASYMHLFREANLTFGDAKAGRLFLCGSPRAAIGQQFQVQELQYSRSSSYTSKDGFIYVEHVKSKKSHKYVDVLMLCSRHKSREVATKYVMKHIVQELISFCASPKGCPGVALVLGVIQTFCVETLIPSHLRGAILIEKLKLDFIRSINDKLEEMPLETSQLEELLHYEYCWPPIERHTGGRSERARDLLWESEVEAVNEIRQEQIEELKKLQEGLISVENDLAQSNLEAEYMVSDSNFLQMKDCKPPTSRCLSRASTSVENRSTLLVLLKIDQLAEKLVQKVDGLDERLRSVQSIVQRLEMKMGQILSLHQELLSTMSDFVSKVDRIIQYSHSLEQARTPKRPYMTNDVGIFYRMSVVLHNGTAVRLQLMCESVIGFHIVKDQEGLKIRLDRENSSLIRKTIEISYKVMYYAVKAGLDKTLNLGQAIPDWEDFKSDIVQLDGISDDDHRAFLKGGESKELQEAWLRIQQTLAPQLQNRYSGIFKLYQVKYVVMHSLFKAKEVLRVRDEPADGL